MTSDNNGYNKDAIDLGRVLELRDLFFDRMLRRRLRGYQRPLSDRIVCAVFNREMVELFEAWGRQSGKTQTVADTDLFLTVFYPQLVGEDFLTGVFAPKEEQCLNLIERMDRGLDKRWLSGLGEVRSKSSLRFIFDWNLPGRPVSGWHGMSASPEAKIEGWPFNLILVDEAEDVDEGQLKNAIFPMGADKQASKVLTGFFKPSIVNWYWYQHILGGGPDSRRLGWEVAAAEVPHYREYVELERERLGEDSDEFKTQYKLELVERTSFFIDRDSLARCSVPSYSEDSSLGRFAGWDVAKRQDSSVVTILEGKFDERLVVVDWLEMHGEDYEEQMEMVREFCMRYGVRSLCIDVSGVGDPVCDVFSKKYSGGRVEGVKTGSPLVADRLYKQLSLQMIPGEDKQPKVYYRKSNLRECRRFEEQMLSLLKDHRGDYLVCHHPERHGAHDDYCTALALAVEAARVGGGLVFEFLDTR